MTLTEYSQEEIAKISMIELANLILQDKKEARDFRDIFAEVTNLKGFDDQQKEDYIAQFYTDLNIDGRFMTIGSNLWGLKRWYPVEQIDEEVNLAPKKKKKVKKKKQEKTKEEDHETVEELDIVDNDLEVLTGDFKEVADDEDEEDFDEEFAVDYDDEEEDLDDEDEDEEMEDDEEDSEK